MGNCASFYRSGSHRTGSHCDHLYEGKHQGPSPQGDGATGLSFLKRRPRLGSLVPEVQFLRSQPPESAVNLGRPRIEGCKRTPLHCQRQSELSFGYSHRHLLFQTTVEDMRYQLSLSKSRPLQRDSICMSPLQGPLSPWQDPVGPASPSLSARDRLGQRQVSVLRSLARALCSLPRTFFSSLKNNNNKQQQTTKNKKTTKNPALLGLFPQISELPVICSWEGVLFCVIPDKGR